MKNEWYEEPGKQEKKLIKVGVEDGKAQKRWKVICIHPHLAAVG